MKVSKSKVNEKKVARHHTLNEIITELNMMILLLSRHALYLTYMARNSVVVFYSCCIMLCTSGTTCITGRCQCMRKACHYHGISLLMLDYVLDMFSIIFRLTSNIYIYYIHHATYRQLLTQFLLLFTSITYHGRSSVTLI